MWRWLAWTCGRRSAFQHLHVQVQVDPFDGVAEGASVPSDEARVARSSGCPHRRDPAHVEGFARHGDTDPLVAANDEALGARGVGGGAALEAMWRRLLSAQLPADAPVQFPTYSALREQLFGADGYGSLLECRDDWRGPSACPKRVCAVGAIARAQIEWTDGASGWTGLFSETAHGLLRLSSAIEPPAISQTLPAPVRGAIQLLGGALGRARLFPACAFKVLRPPPAWPASGAVTRAAEAAEAAAASAPAASAASAAAALAPPSANLLFMGPKQGVASPDFFSGACTLATRLDEELGGASTLIQPLLDAFKRHSAYPCELGLSDFAAPLDSPADGPRAFPWVLILRPTERVPASHAASHAASPSDPREGASRDGASSSGLEAAPDLTTAFVRQILATRVGTHLYDVYAVDTPSAALRSDGARLVGRMTTTSPFIRSKAEAALSFWHQRREDDYACCPHWISELHADHKGCGPERFAQLAEHASRARLAHR